VKVKEKMGQRKAIRAKSGGLRQRLLLMVLYNGLANDIKSSLLPDLTVANW
jgi:hypothetical protein